MDSDFIQLYMKYSAVIAGVISFIITIFNKEHIRYEKNKEKYFNDFLIKFYNAYRNNRNINIKKFFNKNYSYLDNYIPTYVNYLIENREFDKLKKVLIVDYFCYYSSESNTVKITFYKIFKPVWFIEYCMIYVLTISVFFLGILLIPMSIDEIIGRISNTHYSNVDFYGLNMPAPLFMIGMLAVLGLLIFIMKFISDSWIRKDIYTYDKKYIEKIIKSRENEYIKLKNKVYFL